MVLLTDGAALPDCALRGTPGGQGAAPGLQTQQLTYRGIERSSTWRAACGKRRRVSAAGGRVTALAPPRVRPPPSLQGRKANPPNTRSLGPCARSGRPQRAIPLFRIDSKYNHGNVVGSRRSFDCAGAPRPAPLRMRLLSADDVILSGGQVERKPAASFTHSVVGRRHSRVESTAETFEVSCQPSVGLTSKVVV